jgi:hypothetical protein
MRGSPRYSHHVTLSRLRVAYWAISPKAAAGVDAMPRSLS